MNAPPEFTSKDAEYLMSFLSSSAVPEGTMNYFSTAGLLFAVASCPEFIRPSEWMPVIFSEEEMDYEAIEDAERVISSLLGLYNLINDQVRAGDPQLPPGCVLRRDPMDNLEEEAPLSDWSWGFAEGHRWLSKIWEEAPDNIVNEYAAILMILYFFTSRTMAEKIRKENKRQDMTLEEMAAEVIEQFGEAMRGYAALGMALAQRRPEPGRTGSAPAVKIGRNEPCPCGSGKKYKKCCLNSGTGGGNGNGTTDALMEDLWESVESKSFESPEDLQAHTDHFMEAKNTEPIDNFAGLSAGQMTWFLYSGFDQGSPVVFNTDLAIPADVPFLRLFIPLVRELGEGPLKETVTGNLPRKTVRAVALDYFGDLYLTDKRFMKGFRGENDFPALHVVRLIANMGGFIKKRYQRFSLTKRGEAVLSDGVSGEMFLRLFETCTRKFNWAYRDGFPDLPIVQMSAFFALYLLQRFGDVDRPLSFYEEKFLTAFPMTLREVPEREYMSREDTVRRCFTVRAMERFAHFFGFMEYAEERPKQLLWEERVVRKTPFLDDWISFQLDRT